MSIENCLLKIPRISEEFSVAHIIQAVGDYTKDGLERKSAEKRAVSDHIADLEERRAEIQRIVAMAYSARARQEPTKPEASPSLMEKIVTSKGPAFDGQDISLRADGFVGGSKDRHRFTIADVINKDEGIGDLVLGIENGKITRLHVLTVDEEKRGQGIGSRIVKSIVETAGGPVQIRDITPDSLEFWRKVGLYNETEEARHGTISPASNARAEKVSEAKRRAPEGADKASARSPRTQGKEKAARIERLASYLKEQLGEKTFSKLKGKVFQLVNEEDIPQSVRDHAEKQAPGKPIAGYVHRGVPHIVVENVTTDGGRSDAFAVLMHEVGVHTGLRGMLGEKLFSELLSAVEDAANGKGDPRMVIAARNVKLPKGTPESLRSEELAAYIVQDMATQDVPLMKKVWAALKAFLYRLGITTEIDPLMLRELARGAMNHVAKVMTVNEMDSMFIGEKLDAIREAESERFARTTEPRQTDTTDIRYATSQDIRFSFADTISEQASNYLTRWKGISLWRRSVGQPYDLAKRDKDKNGKAGTLGTFGYFFKYAQGYMRTSSGLAIQSESLAPSFLLRMDRLQDAFKRGLQKADIALVGTSLYEGTLSDPSGNPLKGKRWTEDEFKAQYSTDPKMWALYEEARAAVDDSIDTNAKGVAVKLARTFGILQSIEASLPDIVKDTTKQANAMLIQESKDLPKKEGALALLEDTLKITPKTDKDKRKELRKRVKGAKKELQSAKDKIKGLEKLIEDVGDIQEHAGKLKDHGYFPLMRFGEYTITAHPVDKTQPITFLRFESQADANRMLKAYQADPEFDKVVKGVLNEKEFEMYKGITTETMSMFIKKLPIGNYAAVQTFMEEVVSTRSALKRMLHRKGIPGYDTDMVRTLASFITSNARMASMNAHLQDMEEGIQAIPKEKGDFRGYANDLKKYLMEPKEEAQGIRSFLFLYFIGMSPASAIVQASQPVMMSYPYLSQFIGTRKAAAYIAQAMGEAVVHATPNDVKDALERARREGVTAPHETHLLQATARGAVGAHGILNKGMKIWGSFFSLTEQFNREATFIAAYRIGMKLKGQFDIKDPYAFAVDAVDGTQLIYSRVNRAPWARGPIGSTILTFQAFKVGYIEFLMRLPRKERAVAITLLLLAAGTAGFPGADDLDDIIDTVLQLGGYPSQIAKTKHELIREVLGEAWGDVFEKGLSVLLPLDWSLRMGFGDLFPGTAVIKPSETDREREVTQMLGPLGGVLLQGKQALERGIRGDAKGAIFAMAPKAARDVWKAVEMWQTGQFQDIKGRLKLPATKRQAVIKGFGFQPAPFARAAEESTRHYETLALHKLKRDEIAELWSEGKATFDSEKVNDAKEMRNEWNRDHPDMKIDIRPESIRQRVKNIRMTELQRQRKATPRSMRQ